MIGGGGKDTESVHKHNIWREKEPKRNRTEVLLLMSLGNSFTARPNRLAASNFCGRFLSGLRPRELAGDSVHEVRPRHDLSALGCRRGRQTGRQTGRQSGGRIAPSGTAHWLPACRPVYNPPPPPFTFPPPGPPPLPLSLFPKEAAVFVYPGTAWSVGLANSVVRRHTVKLYVPHPRLWIGRLDGTRWPPSCMTTTRYTPGDSFTDAGPLSFLSQFLRTPVINAGRQDSTPRWRQTFFKLCQLMMSWRWRHGEGCSSVACDYSQNYPEI